MDKTERYCRYLPEEQAATWRHLASFGLDVRTINCMVNEGITNLADFRDLTVAQILRWPNFGRKSLHLLEGILAENGMELKATGDYGDPELRLLIDKANTTRAALKVAEAEHKAAVAAVQRRRFELWPNVCA